MKEVKAISYGGGSGGSGVGTGQCYVAAVGAVVATGAAVSTGGWATPVAAVAWANAGVSCLGGPVGGA
ncbi:hypothetical protein BJL83_20835 [Vibrio parahaemolyticus]|nr:hypothetical protein BJL83_20835 [Vibrio parahaemolyticus]